MPNSTDFSLLFVLYRGIVVWNNIVHAVMTCHRWSLAQTVFTEKVTSTGIGALKQQPVTDPNVRGFSPLETERQSIDKCWSITSQLNNVLNEAHRAPGLNSSHSIARMLDAELARAVFHRTHSCMLNTAAKEFAINLIGSDNGCKACVLHLHF